MLPLTTILHPTDFSEYSDFAFRLACALARDYNARLILLHVIPEPMVVNGIAAIPEAKWPSVEEVKEHLRQMEGRAHHVRVESQVKEGDAADTILRTAEETNSDVIVMGTHGRTALARLLMGSVAELVLRKAPCPVLTAKPFLGQKRFDADNDEKADVRAAVKDRSNAPTR